MDNAAEVQTSQMAGLFRLSLETESKLAGAPALHLSLTIDTVNDIADGAAEVTQALADPVVCTSHVHGTVNPQYTMDPSSSKIRIDLTGYPLIHWPQGGGVGPVFPPNFKAQLLMETDYQKGNVIYQYQTSNGSWVKIEQKIHTV
ncbi:MAG: DUF1842 domain-containing protein [Magnetovibrio sp.]|nr:DUF1842 domain-containing protein [Magnetovibrio sp.]